MCFCRTRSVCAAGKIHVTHPLFSAADAYELFMGRWSRTLAPLFVRFADARDLRAVLDVGSGTGALAAAIAAIEPEARIVGVDPAAPYVAIAQATRPSENVTFEVGDAQHLRFDAASFDCALSLLAFNFIPNPTAALLELMRVVRPGGVVAAAVWDYGSGMQMLRVFWDEAIALIPEDDKSDERHMPLTGRGQLAELWRRNGLSQVVENELTIEMAFDSFDDYWRPFTQKQGPAGAYVAGLTDPQRDELRMRLRQRLLGVDRDRPFALGARAWAARGVVV